MNCPRCGCEYDDGAETCPGCMASLRFARRAGSAAGVPVYRYLLCECVECGWNDQFREDLVRDGKVNGHCDRCNDVRTFNCIERPNAQRSATGDVNGNHD